MQTKTRLIGQLRQALAETGERLSDPALERIAGLLRAAPPPAPAPLPPPSLRTATERARERFALALRQGRGQNAEAQLEFVMRAYAAVAQEAATAAAPVARGEHPALGAVRDLTGVAVPRELVTTVTRLLGRDFDREKLALCHAVYVKVKGRADYVWLTAWYTQGIPAWALAAYKGQAASSTRPGAGGNRLGLTMHQPAQADELSDAELASLGL